MLKRPRRLRRTQAIRELVQENTLCINDLICPLFIVEGQNQKQEISSMPDYYRFSQDLLLKEINEVINLGIKAIALFPAISNEKRSCDAKEAYNENGLIPETVKKIKLKFPELCVITDVALDPFTDHAHDGIQGDDGDVLNDETIEILCKTALCQAKAGSDIVAPSDMMDGRVKAIRKCLDENNFTNVSIMSYSAKYASAFYGPFRDAISSKLKGKLLDKKTYQMNPANSKEAEREILLDIEEGADFVMVKPALSYLDVIRRASEISSVPVVAYSVSGEYSMLKASFKANYLDENSVIFETALSMKRAGADLIISYFAKDLARLLISV